MAAPEGAAGWDTAGLWSDEPGGVMDAAAPALGIRKGIWISPLVGPGLGGKGGFEDW